MKSNWKSAVFSVKKSKTFKIMRLLMIFCFFFVSGAMANGYSQEQVVSLNLHQCDVNTLCQEIWKQTGLRFIYNEEHVKNLTAFDVKADKKTVREVLDQVFDNTSLRYFFEQDVIYILAKSGQVKKPETKQASGTVKDKKGEPLPGVTVLIKGTHNGVVTDIDGNFMIKIPSDTVTFVFSFVGMKKQEVKYAPGKKLNIVMEEDVEQMEEVVVTGYQTLSKERNAGSFGIVSGSEIKERVGLTGSVLESMEGLTSGLNINYADGQDKYLIRGLTSISSNRSPLFVVDGVAMSSENFENMVNSNDIENITFLKDATAASIWGARAANGVVVITTKKGKDTDRKIKISYDGSFTYKGMPDFGYMEYMSSGTLIKSATEIFDPEFYTWNAVTTTNNGIGGFLPIVYPHELPMYKAVNKEYTEAERDEELARLASLNNRSQIEDLFMQPAFFTNHSLSFMGGSGVHRYYGSLGFGNDQTNDKVRTNKYMLNLKQDFNFTDWLKIDLTVNLAMTDKKNKSMYSVDNSILPYMMFKDENGNALSHSVLKFYEPDRLNYENLSGVSLDYIPLEDNRDGFNKSTLLNARVNAGIEIKLWKGLSYSGRFQYQRSEGKAEQFNDQESFSVRRELVEFAQAATTENGVPTFYLPETGGHYTNTSTYNTDWTVRNQLMYDRNFEESVSHVTGLAGMEVRGTLTNSHGTFSRGYDPQTMTYNSYDEGELIKNGIKNPILKQGTSAVNKLTKKHFTDSETEYRFVSFYANGAYTYNSKYTLNASIRVDQSNLFGSDPSVQYKPVWSVGGAWTLGQENFMQNISWLDRLVLRFSYGLGGNSPDPGLGGPYDVLIVTQDAAYPGKGYNVVTPANDKLTWEKTRTVNAGVDFSVLQGRLNGSLDAYFKKTTDLLGNVPLNPVTGWVNALANLGTMTNKGFEFSLNSQNMSGVFNWSTNFTLTYNKNKIEELSVANALSPSSIIYENYVEGYAAGSLFAYRWAGLDNMGDPQVYDENGEKVKLTQDLTDLKCMRYMGTMQAPWYGGLTNTFSYKGIELSCMFVYNLGHKMRNDVNQFYAGRITSNLHKDFDKRWRQPGDENITDIPSYEANTKTSTTRRDISLYRFSDQQVLDASYIKLRNLSLAYALPSGICDRLSAENIKIRFQVSNLFYWAANHQGIDPEAMNLRNGVRATQFGPSWSIGLTVNFK